MAAPKTVLIGDRVRYESVAGTIRGEVVRIRRAMNAKKDMIDWIHVEYHDDNAPTKKRIAVLADTALEMMKFKVIFRDVNVQKAAA